MGQEPATSATLEFMPTTGEIQKLYGSLAFRSLARKNAGLPAIDTKAEYQRGIALIRSAKFKAAFALYVADARTELPVSTGFMGRMCANHHAKRIALCRFVREAGINPMDLPIPVSQRLQLIDDLVTLNE